MGRRAGVVAVIGAVVVVGALSACAQEGAEAALTVPTGAAPKARATTPPTAAEATAPTLGRGTAPLAAGTYRVDLAALDESGASTHPPFLVTVPDGWTSRGGSVLGPKDSTLAVAFWDVEAVFTDPCRWMGTDVEPGPGVDDLVHLLVTIPSRGQSAPRPVEVGGRSGRYLEWSVPTDLRMTATGQAPACDEDANGNHPYKSWTGKGWAGTRFQQGPGQLDQLWILDVGDERLVIDAMSMPENTMEELATLTEVVESIRFLDE
ncbi:hypothetical protein [Oryzobacter terrae]|uniref:hypothetical protein n=1 Tax=Oryzobacter terrae TaxID=1620385 RepID=UPI0036704FBA